MNISGVENSTFGLYIKVFGPWIASSYGSEIKRQWSILI